MTISRSGLGRVLPLTAVALLLLCSGGCSRKEDNLKIEKLKIVRGAGQCALPGEKFRNKLIIEIQGPNEPGLLGGKGQRIPLPGRVVQFVPIDGSDLKLSCQEAESNDGGSVMVEVAAGNSVGDQYLQVIPVKAPEKRITIRFTSGIKILGGNQETHANGNLSHPLGIQVFKAKDVPAEGVPVYFNLSDTPGKRRKSSAKLASEIVFTNAKGIAETNFKVGGNTGSYTVDAEIADKKTNIFIRSIPIEVMGLNLPQLFITVLGGLALFILGMTMMSDGLQIVAGENMKRFLQFFTSNRFVAVLAGTAVTAVIQSSSACSVMVIGFVNAGLLKLFQAIGIVLGADIGTTVTAQIISFKLEVLALPSIIIGAVIVIVVKNKVARGWGSTILGFGLLFFGMGMMGNDLKTIGSFPTFVNFFRSFDCQPTSGYMPVLHVIGAFGIGALLTVVIQSSSASIGIIMALAGSSLINFYTAMPLMLGANVGTTITAVIACLPTNKRAKQVALSHVLTKTFGTVYMLILFYWVWPGTEKPIFMYVVNLITRGNAFAAPAQNVMRHVANAHTLFNVINVALFIPLIGVVEKICNWIIPVKDESEVKITSLEPHLLDTPQIAIEQVIDSLRNMLNESWLMVDTAVNKHFSKINLGDKSITRLEKTEEDIDQSQEDITNYLVQLTRRELTEPQAAIIPLLMHCTNDAEKIADHTENIVQLTRRLKKTKQDISKRGRDEIAEIWKLLDDQARNILTALQSKDPQGATIALTDEKKINKLTDKYEKSHIKRLNKGDCDPTVGIIFVEMLGELEKIGDHLSNIAERTPEIQKHYFETR